MISCLCLLPANIVSLRCTYMYVILYVSLTTRRMPTIVHVFCNRISTTTSEGSITIFGASERENSVGEVVFRNLLSAGFDGGIYPINPKRDTIQGQKAYRCIGDVDDAVDLAVVITPAPTIPAIVQECGEKGVKMMIIISAGFREAGNEGRKIEDEVVRIAKDYRIRFIGPNCLGLIRPREGINLTFGNNNASPGNLALVSQSGAICTAILDWAEEVSSLQFSARNSNWRP